ncbi:MAG: ABC transporter substrate-binding protein [Clostridia bacterium]|nr:ABC transporter substrate-binding protein [Clostridia bacterium]
MTKKLVALLLALLLALPMGGALAENAGVTVTDMMGRSIMLAAPATRIVALTAADCEILCALGCEDVLVGRGEYCDYPPSVLEKPSVQSGYETNIEEIVALQPQVVLMGTMAQTAEQADALAAAGIQTVISDAQDIEGTYTAIRLIGALMGKDAEAEALISGMQDTFAAIEAKSENTGKTVYFEVSPLQWGLWAAGKGTFMDELATMCGLTNAFADVDGWGQISEEQVLERDPDYIVTISMYYGEGPTPVEEIKGRAGWESLKAVVNDDILNADSNEISRPGPRLQDAAETIYEFVYGDAAEEPAA